MSADSYSRYTQSRIGDNGALGVYVWAARIRWRDAYVEAGAEKDEKIAYLRHSHLGHLECEAGVERVEVASR